MKRSKDIVDMLSAVKSDFPSSSVPNQPDERDIIARADEIYESKGHADGADPDDWLQAERELQQ